MHEILKKFRQNPIGLMRRGLYKILIAPLRYRSREGYDAARYWHDRFIRHGTSMQAVGDEGLSEQDNMRAYAQAATDFINFCQREGLDLTSSRVLEIGCGNGFYTQLLWKNGVRDYVGIDITDALFPKLQPRFPGYRFLRQDVTADKIVGEFDFVLMIDVIEHIVGVEKLGFALDNVQNCLAGNGRFLVSPVFDKGQHTLFYVRFWAEKEVRQHLSACSSINAEPFRNSRMLIVRMNAP
jgi:SAM-dependent methyltransferase